MSRLVAAGARLYHNNGRPVIWRILVIPILTVLIATSYIALAVADTDLAAGLWAPYAIVMCVLAYLNFCLWWWSHGAR